MVVGYARVVYGVAVPSKISTMDPSTRDSSRQKVRAPASLRPRCPWDAFGVAGALDGVPMAVDLETNGSRT